MIFRKLNPEKIWHEKLTDLSTSPVICSHFILGKQEQFIFNSTTHTHFWLFMLHRRKQTVIHLPTTPENVTTLTCELQNFFIWLNVCCILSNVGSSKKRELWVVAHGSEKNWLWCVATGMSGKKCHSRCLEWSPSPLIHASSLFWHWSVAQYTTLCWNPAHVATSCCHKSQHVHINTCTPPVACPRCSTRAMQIIGSFKQQ